MFSKALTSSFFLIALKGSIQSLQHVQLLLTVQYYCEVRQLPVLEVLAMYRARSH